MITVCGIGGNGAVRTQFLHVCFDIFCCFGTFYHFHRHFNGTCFFRFEQFFHLSCQFVCFYFASIYRFRYIKTAIIITGNGWLLRISVKRCGQFSQFWFQLFADERWLTLLLWRHVLLHRSANYIRKLRQWYLASAGQMEVLFPLM